MPSKGTKRRSVRVEDEIWLPALAKAAEREESLSDIIRDALRAYIGQGKGSAHGDD